MEVKWVVTTLATSFFVATAIVFTPAVFAAEPSATISNSTINAPLSFPMTKFKNEITLSGGLNVSSLSNGNQAVAINSFVTNTYDTDKKTSTNGMMGLSYARLFHLRHDIAITVGPGLYYTNFNDVNGLEHPASNILPNLDTLNYQYSATAWSLFAESKLVYEKYKWQPFITGGIGPSWNQLSGYSEVATDPSGMASPNSSVPGNNTKTAFAYEVGCGLQRIIYSTQKQNVVYRLSLAYQYMNLGEGALAPASISTTGQAIKVNTMDTNAILLAIGASF